MQLFGVPGAGVTGLEDANFDPPPRPTPKVIEKK